MANELTFWHTTQGTAVAGGFQHFCRRCGLNQIVAGYRFKHLCRADPRDPLTDRCRHLGAMTDETHQCQGCPGSPRVHALFECAKFGRCLPQTSAQGVACCLTCDHYPIKLKPQP